MLSVTTATVHCSMCPNTPTNTTPERKDKSWSCDFNLAKNARGRGQASTCKNLDLRLGTPVELNVEVSHHATDEELKTPDSKKPPHSSVSTSKLRRHSVALLRKNRCPNQRRITDELTNDDVQGHDEETEERDDQKETEESIKFSSDENEAISSKNEDKSFSSSSPLPATGGKRKRQTESRISVALKMLKPQDNEPIYATSRKNHDTTIQDDTPKPSLTSLDTTEEPSENTSYVQYVSWDDLVEARDGNVEYQTRENWPTEPQDYSSNHRDNWDDLRQDCYYWLHNREESRNSWDESSAPPPPEPEPENLPYYMVGFPNPPGENRCWLNATLQMLLALPLNDYLARLNLDRSSALTQTFVALQQFWKQGAEKTDVMLRTIKKFRGQLSVLDRLYSSEAQQDVSEFLTLLLNHMKNDCDTMLKVSSDESENVPDNAQNSENIVRSPSTTPTKRPPLTQISPFKRQITCNDTTDRQADESSPNKQLSEEPSSQQSQQIKNPINELFNISMVEHQICHNCKKRQQRRVDELMLYVSVPNDETDSLDLAEAINKTNAPVKGDSTCSKCNGNEHTFYRKFKECPNVLIVQINRYAISDGCIAKMNTTVHIPETLTLSTVETQNAPAQDHVFVPVCAIAHVGGAMDCGHYTSYVRHGDQWFYYNDMSVEPMSSAEALSAVETTAYLVFFANANFLPSTPGLTEEITEEEVSR